MADSLGADWGYSRVFEAEAGADVGGDDGGGYGLAVPEVGFVVVDAELRCRWWVTWR